MYICYIHEFRKLNHNLIRLLLRFNKNVFSLREKHVKFSRRSERFFSISILCFQNVRNVPILRQGFEITGT